MATETHNRSASRGRLRPGSSLVAAAEHFRADLEQKRRPKNTIASYLFDLTVLAHQIPAKSINQITAIDDFPEDQVSFVDSKPVADVTVFPLAGTVRFSLNRALAKKGDAGDTLVIEARFQVKSTVQNGATVVNTVNVPPVPGEVSLANNTASSSVSISVPTTPNSYTALLPLVIK